MSELQSYVVESIANGAVMPCLASRFAICTFCLGVSPACIGFVPRSCLIDLKFLTAVIVERGTAVDTVPKTESAC